MAKNVEDIRNIAVCGHGSSGKTTLVDQLLVKTGAVSGQPSVDTGTSICDFDEEEKHHKHSIEASVVHFDHARQAVQRHRHARLSRSHRPDDRRAAGGGNGGDRDRRPRRHQGEHAPRVAGGGRRRLGRILCITKLDTDNINFPGLIDSIKEVFGTQCALFNVPIGQGHDLKGVVSTLDVPKDTAGALIDPAELSESVIESIIEADEAVMEKYFEGEMPSKEELQRLCAEAVRQGTLTPIVCVSTKMGVGLDELLAVLAQASLPPSAVPRTAKKDGDDVTLKADPAAPLAAQVFKTRIDPFVQRLSYIRVYSGTLKKDSTVPSPGSRKGIKIGPLLSVQADKTTPRRSGDRRRHRGRGQDRRLAHGHVAGRGGAAADQVSRRRWSAWPSRPRPAATKRNSPARCTRSPRRTAPFTSSTTRKPRRWCSPA